MKGFVPTIFIAWKIWLSVFLILGVVFLPHKLDFLGGGAEHYLRFPWFWGWANFDGEHYLAIAQHGYGNGEQAFFFLYPLLIRTLSWPLRGDLYFLGLSALFISTSSFFLGLIGLWKLLEFDFKKEIIQLVMLTIIVFPTSFYFGSVYTEALFFCFSVWAFYFARKGNWLLAGLLGALSSMTRFLGIFLLPVFIIEWWLQRKNSKIDPKVAGILLIPFGLLFYMFYLFKTTGDPFAFLHTLSMFGEQRSSTPIVLPQVFWRYFKILVDVPKDNPIFLTTLLEFVVAVGFLLLSFLSFVKLRLSYAIWLTLGYIIPTLSGSFSSLPRYVLPLFPGFLIMAIYLNKKSILIKAAFLVSFFVLLGVFTMLFTRAYWVS